MKLIFSILTCFFFLFAKGQENKELKENVKSAINNKLIEKAKETLVTTNLSVSEIAYQLGFEHPQSFSKLFKNKTKVTPKDFRSTFN